MTGLNTAGSLPATTAHLLQLVRACTLCEPHLPLGVRQVLQVHPAARILVVGQAPGIRVHNSGVPFDDASGDRLREWMGITREVFYDPLQMAIVPMGFCYPGTGKSGDLPPRPECAPHWRQQVLAHLPQTGNSSVTSSVERWQEFAPGVVPLPHPSPRNNIWLKRNPWFAETLLPELKLLVAQALG